METQTIENSADILFSELPSTFTRRDALKRTLDMGYSSAWLGSQLEQAVLTGALVREDRGVYTKADHGSA